jgi:hypothetical protein
MKRYIKNNRIYITEYSSLSEFITDINSLPNNRFYPNTHDSQKVEKTGRFTGTTDYQQATHLLTHGWDSAAQKMTAKVRMNQSVSTVSRSSKPAYGVVGSQASVPRYLQGIPTNMISRQTTYSKQKVVTITKGISYAAKWTTDQILEESIKALQIIQSMENAGQRVRLNVMLATTCDDCIHTHVCKVCIKQPDERLNISKMSFALAHPSMLRHFFIKWIEVDPFAEYDLGWSFGTPSEPSVKEKAMEENEYYIPEKIENMNALIEQFSRGEKKPAKHY